jgi:hypothetical protein
LYMQRASSMHATHDLHIIGPSLTVEWCCMGFSMKMTDLSFWHWQCHRFFISPAA